MTAQEQTTTSPMGDVVEAAGEIITSACHRSGECIVELREIAAACATLGQATLARKLRSIAMQLQEVHNTFHGLHGKLVGAYVQSVDASSRSTFEAGLAGLQMRAEEFQINDQEDINGRQS